MSSKRKYFSGASVSQAVLKAARAFGLNPDDVAWQDAEKKTGFVRGRCKVVIAVDPAMPKREVAEVEVIVPEVAKAERSAEPEANLEVAAEFADEAIKDDAPIEEPIREVELDREDAYGNDDGDDRDGDDVGDDDVEDNVEPREIVIPDFSELDEAPPLEPVEAEREDAVWDCLEPLLRLADLEIEAEIGERGGELVVELIGPDSGRVVERHGELLDALGQLLPRLLSSEFGERVSCRIDCEGFWYKREMELCRTAFAEARRAVREGSSRSLQPMNPRERRIVHQAIADIEGVTTESRGDGRRKRVVIRPI